MTILTVTGRLGRDANVTYTPNGTAVSNLAVAYNYGQKGADGNRPTQWVDCTLWGEQAVKLREYLLKGTVLCLALRDVHIETFTRRDSTVGSKLAGTVINLEFAPKQRDREKPTEEQENIRQSKPNNSRRSSENTTAFQDVDLPFDDDIPF